ncbi:MAG: GNAT family N-acetyltransferase [Chitinivibrionales bacterium]|nr:GNAT family N-acetyltransferase [Chitinivibrionales bacterium]
MPSGWRRNSAAGILRCKATALLHEREGTPRSSGDQQPSSGTHLRRSHLYEAMIAWVAQGTLLGIGGICEEPYLHIPRYGRVRHVYVLQSARRRGIGSALMRGVLCFARQHYDLVTLRTPKDGSADRFYERLGFVKHDGLETVTHVYRTGGCDA